MIIGNTKLARIRAGFFVHFLHTDGDFYYICKAGRRKEINVELDNMVYYI